MKKFSSHLLAVLAVSAFAVSAARAGAFEDLGMASGLDVTPLKVQVAALQRESQQRLTIPRDRKDLFAACSVIDAKTFRAYSLPEAAQALQGCLDQTFAGRKYTVTARPGRFSMRACPQAAGQLSCQAIVEVQGLIITVDGAILMGDGALADLNFSLNKRGGKLLGFKAIIDNKAVLAK